MPAPQQIFAALSDPTRIRILALVAGLQLAVGELADLLGQSQPRVSRHIRILAEAGLVTRIKEGAFVFIGLAPGDTPLALAAMVRAMTKDSDFLAPEEARLAEVRAERQRAVDEWFHANAAEWGLLRRMAGAGDGIEQAIRAAARPEIGRLLDIGTGTGGVLALLVADAKSATGVDRSPEMLRFARGNLTNGEGRQLAELRQADMHRLPFPDASFDTATMLYVLHFTDDPQGALVEAGRVLAPGGKLLVADYALHDHETLRSRFRHVRLGFSEQAVLQYLAKAGLRGRVHSRHEGPELTTILWEGRKEG